MENSTAPLLTAITMLGIIALLFFINEFFRKYKIVKKQKSRKRKSVCKIEPTTDDLKNAIDLQLVKMESHYHDLREIKFLISKQEGIANPTKTVLDKIALDVSLANYYSSILKEWKYGWHEKKILITK